MGMHSPASPFFCPHSHQPICMAITIPKCMAITIPKCKVILPYALPMFCLRYVETAHPASLLRDK